MEYTLRDKTYRLHYSVSRLELIEKVCGCSVFSVVTNLSDGEVPSISVLKCLFAYGLMEDNGVYAPTAAAMQFAGEELERVGYVDMAKAAIGQIMEDCGFLFQIA